MKIRKIQTSVCLFCEVRATYDELPLCRHCIRTLQEVMEQKCKNCGMIPCECSCNSSKKIHFLFFFDNYASRLIIYWLKTNFEQRKMDFFAELLVKSSNIDPKKFDGVTYVPRWKRNIKKYGYDQAEEMAKAISKIFGIPFIRALKRVGKGDQKLLSSSQRKIHIKNKFALRYIPDQKFKQLLIVDDIITTGSTIEVCTDMLRKGFSQHVIPMVLARTNYKKQ